MGPSWVLPSLEALLLVPLGLTTPHRVAGESMRVRHGALLLIGVIGAGERGGPGPARALLLGGGRASGSDLLVSAITIWLTNVLVFALCY